MWRIFKSVFLQKILTDENFECNDVFRKTSVSEMLKLVQPVWISEEVGWDFLLIAFNQNMNFSYFN